MHQAAAALCIRPYCAAPTAQFQIGLRPSRARSLSRIKLCCWETDPKRRDCDSTLGSSPPACHTPPLPPRSWATSTHSETALWF
ncbi:hypothetical protein BDP81DRAFT_415504 [Colletotrichum phormii]|uniref:Uncharacterized protein n=1 Tax=Colletotrichum phormii TaxID=359342 RepID=A0AAJ0A0S7_9PEZI|nr:uncharacterized protein BDP81DRAFT_415504 [Colletotrichum phormii]KAK1654350.1 hypothetical protein BDP81DRAFT_415504 [Colletotrichum phormii]